MRKLIFILFLLVSASAFSQNELLAKNYFEQGEYEKALSIYEKLYQENIGRLDYLLAMVQANQQLERFATAESLIKTAMGLNKMNPTLYIERGYNYSLQQKQNEASNNYAKAREMAKTNPNYAYSVGATLEKYNLLDEAIAVYEDAMAQDERKDFNAQVARIYGELGKLDKMFNSYLDLIASNPGYQPAAQQNFSLFITDDPLNEANSILRKVLLQRSQQNQAVVYNELLSWLFIQQKEYKKAFVQEKAIYKRTEYDLHAITDLAMIAIADQDFENATEIVNFVIENSTTPDAKIQGNQYLMKIALETASPKDFPEIEKKFEKLLEEFGTGSNTYLLQIDYNHYLAFDENKLEKAIGNLKNLLNDKLTIYQEARVKMELADILVFDEKFNEALIYYSQIQKKVQSDVLAQEARFKVAETSYFKGDFDWAQIQLDVLKKSTSQLIANDAMKLSLLIRENSLEDSTKTALIKYARADLLALQNKNTAAIDALAEILENHKGEKIEDEALLKQGELYEKTGQFDKAEADYLKIIQFYNDDILADDAHYRLAKLYEDKLNQPDKAKEMYGGILFNFSDSIYFVEARKKYRMLRGDEIN